MIDEHVRDVASLDRRHQHVVAGLDVENLDVIGIADMGRTNDTFDDLVDGGHFIKREAEVQHFPGVRGIKRALARPSGN